MTVDGNPTIGGKSQIMAMIKRDEKDTLKSKCIVFALICQSSVSSQVIRNVPVK